MNAADAILPGRLYQGSIDANALDPRPTLHVACAIGHPPSPDSARDVFFFPIEDDPTTNWLTKPLWIEQVLKVVDLVAQRVYQGDRVLVTCHAGLNRSGLVSALALCALGMEPDEAIKLVRERRSPDALFNQQFVRVIKTLGRAV